MAENKPLTFGSLFAGIGGFDLGFERAGMICKWQVEIDDYATKVLAKHWPHVHRERDIRECGSHNLEPVDVICGGFPCQDISYAGLGAGLDGERSGLFFEAIRLVRQLQPRIVVLENVAALLTRGMDRVLGTLAAIGYDAEWHCIPAASVGAPHIRDRVFVVAHSHANSGGRHINGFCYEMADTDNSRSQGMREEWESSKRENTSGHAGQGSLGGRTKSKQWATEPNVGRVAHGVSKRVDRLRGLGNAVVPQVAEWIGRRIVDHERSTTCQRNGS